MPQPQCHMQPPTITGRYTKASYDFFLKPILKDFQAVGAALKTMAPLSRCGAERRRLLPVPSAAGGHHRPGSQQVQTQLPCHQDIDMELCWHARLAHTAVWR